LVQNDILEQVKALEPAQRQATLIALRDLEKSAKKRKRDEYQDDFKELVINDWRTTRNVALTAANINQAHGTHLNDTTVGNWVKGTLSKEEINSIKKKKKITKNKSQVFELEQLLFDWIKAQRMKRLPLTQPLIQKQAQLIFENLKKESADTPEETTKKYSAMKFLASNGWFEKFKRRANLSRRVPTLISAKIAGDYSDMVFKFLGAMRKIR